MVPYKKYLFNLMMLVLIMFSTMSYVSAEVRVDIPNVLDEVKTYKASIIIDEPSLQKYTTGIKYSCNNCDVLLDPKDRSEDDYYVIDLRGRDRIDFYIVGRLDRREQEATGTVSNLKLTFLADNDALMNDFPNEGIYTGTAAEYTKYFGVIKTRKDYDLPSLPSDTDSDWEYDDFFGKYVFHDSQDSSFDKKPMITSYNFVNNNIPALSEYDEYGNRCGSIIDKDTVQKGIIDEDTKLESISLNGGSGYSYVYDDVTSVSPVYDDDGKFLYNLGHVRIGVVISVFNDAEKQCYEGRCEKGGYVKEGDQDSFVIDSIEECKQILDSYKRTPVGSAPSIPKDEFKYNLPVRDKNEVEYKEVCESDSDCDEGKRCTACGECKKEKYVYDAKDAEVEFSFTKKFSSKSIPNTIHNRILIKTKINSKIVVDGKKVDYCSLSYPGLEGYEYVAEMKNDDIYAGFIFGWLLDERRKDTRRDIDLEEDSKEYEVLISPNDKKKIIGLTNDISEEIEFRIEKDGKVVFSDTDNIVLKPISLDIDISSKGQEVHQDSEKVVNYVVKNKQGKLIKTKISLIGPGLLNDGKYEGKIIYSNIKPDEKQKLIYHAPVLGNFDIGKELASLSMVDLQTEAAKQIAQDAVLAYGGEFFGNLDKAAGGSLSSEQAALKGLKEYFKRNPNKYDPNKALEYIRAINAAGSEAENAELLAKAYTLYKGGYDLSNIPKTTVGLRDDIKIATGINDSKNKDGSIDDPNSRKTWTETGAEYGVLGINILQTGVGILTFLPNKIPVVGEASAGLQTAFSAATNIWKANLKYIAKDEKIARAEEKFIPIMILMIAEDESGWQQTKGYILKVAYHEI